MVARQCCQVSEVRLNDDDPTGQPESDQPEEGDLTFLQNEGLEVLALFRSIRDKAKRDLIANLIRVVAESQRHDGREA